MIKITRLNDTELILNAELIECIEATPTTVITLIDGKKITAKETIDEVMDRIIEYKQTIFSAYPLHNKQRAKLEGKYPDKPKQTLAEWIESDE